MTDQEYELGFAKSMDEFHSSNDPKSQVNALENAIRLADASGDLENAFDARLELVRCGTFSGYQDKAMVAFSWCLAQSDKDPERFNPNLLLWKYKWILGNVYCYPQVKREKIFQLQDDFESRLLANGYTLNSVLCLRWKVAMRMGDFERAKEYYAKWKEVPRDSLSDCKACVQNSVCAYLGLIGNYKESAEAAVKLLDGRMVCSVIPQFTYGHMVPTFLRLGRVEELKQNQSKWYKSVKDGQNYITPVSKMMMLAVAFEQNSKAISMFERHAPWAAESTSVNEQFMFFSAAAASFKRMADSETSIRLTVPDSFDFKRNDDEYQCTELAQWFHARATLLADQFNQRNGNDYFSKLIANDESLVHCC